MGKRTEMLALRMEISSALFNLCHFDKPKDTKSSAFSTIIRVPKLHLWKNQKAGAQSLAGKRKLSWDHANKCDGEEEKNPTV